MATSLSYNHVQSTPSTTWVINHNLGHKPVHDVWINYGGNQEKILPLQVIHFNDNTLTVVFSNAQTGGARLF
jgi:hypothetical protein